MITEQINKEAENKRSKCVCGNRRYTLRGKI